MAKLTEQQKEDELHKRLGQISKILDIEVTMIASGEDQKVVPHYNVDATFSKYLALLIYAGLTVPVGFAPHYNRVHADIEYWKKKFESDQS